MLSRPDASIPALIPVAQATTDLDKTIRQRRLAVINMGNNGEISNVLHVHGCDSCTELK